jgi:hypothetical protein
MKTKFESLRRSMSGAITAAALVLGASAQAGAPASPVGDWDMLLSGSGQSGIAFITFSDDGTFSGHQSLVPSQTSISSDSSGGRNPGGDSGRSGFDTNSTGSTVLFGFGPVSGPWQYDDKGHVVGFFTEMVGEGHKVCTTNENISTVHSTTTVPVTNPDGSVTYYETNITIFITNAPTIDCVTQPAKTNSVSFSAKVVPGKRLTMVSSTPNGKVTYRGIPVDTDLIDLSGSWIATRKASGQAYLEIFDLMPFEDTPNIYISTDGSGAGYDFETIVMESAQHKITFTTRTAEDILSASYGSYGFNGKTTKANTRGIQDDGSATPFTFSTSLQPQQ